MPALRFTRAPPSAHLLPKRSLVTASEWPQELSVILGDALVKEGRTREAAVRFASAHVHANTSGIRSKVAAKMDALSLMWDSDPQNRPTNWAKKPSYPANPKNEIKTDGKSKQNQKEAPEMHLHSVGSDGKTTVDNLGKFTPELMEKLQGLGKSGNNGKDEL